MINLNRLIIGLFEYLLILMMILEFNTPYVYFPVIRHAVEIILLLSAIILIIYHWDYISFDIFAFLLIVLVGAILPSLNVVEDKFVLYVKLYFVLLPILLLMLILYARENESAYETFLFKYSNIVYLISIVSLFFWFFGSILEIIPSTAIIPNAWGKEKFIPTYYGIYFETQSIEATEGASLMVRNSGIFNEGPMYNMILCIAISIELFVRKKIKPLRLCTLLITDITVLSTTGFLLLLLIFAIKAFELSHAKYGLQMLLLSPIILIMVFITLSVILDNKKNSSAKSYNNRGDDIVKCVEVGLEHPILGVGVFFKGEEDSSDSKSFGFSNSTFAVFAHGGFYFLVLYLFPLFIVPIIIYCRNRDRCFLMFMMSLFFLFTFTTSKYKIMIIFYIATSLAYWYNLMFKESSSHNRNQ